jgi:hypothetical protein
MPYVSAIPSCPFFAHALPNVLPTFPAPMIAIFMIWFSFGKIPVLSPMARLPPHGEHDE